MAWIELHDEVTAHRKTYDLMTRLKIRRREAVGILSMFWTWALTKAPTGDITGFPAIAIAEATDWNKNPDMLLRALIDSGWVDAGDDGHVTIHDWDVYTWRYFDKLEQIKEQTRKRVADYRKRKTQIHGNEDSVTNVTGTALQMYATPVTQKRDVTQCNAPTVPNLTVPNLTVPNLGTVVGVGALALDPPVEPLSDMMQSEALQEVIRCYEAETNAMITPSIADEFGTEWLPIMPAPLICLAIRTAAKQKKATFAYIEGILKRWKAANILTEAAARQEAEEYQQSRAKREGGVRDAGKAEIPQGAGWDYGETL